MKKVLLYTKNNEKKEQIGKLCACLGAKLRDIKLSELDCTVMSIAAEKPLALKNTAIPAMYVQPELLVFSGFEDVALDAFLVAYRRAGIEPVELKAVVTMYNANRTVYELTAMLTEESARLKV